MALRVPILLWEQPSSVLRSVCPPAAAQLGSGMAVTPWVSLGGCGRAGVTCSMSPAAAARAAPHELPSARRALVGDGPCWALGFTSLPVQVLNHPENPFNWHHSTLGAGKNTITNLELVSWARGWISSDSTPQGCTQTQPLAPNKLPGTPCILLLLQESCDQAPGFCLPFPQVIPSCPSSPASISTWKDTAGCSQGTLITFGALRWP